MALLRVKTKDTLCGWVRAGKIKAIRMPDGSYRFDQVEVLAWLQGRSTVGFLGRKVVFQAFLMLGG